MVNRHLPNIVWVSQSNNCIIFDLFRPFLWGGGEDYTLIRLAYGQPPSPVRGKARTLAVTQLRSSIDRRIEKLSLLVGEGGTRSVTDEGEGKLCFISPQEIVCGYAEEVSQKDKRCGGEIDGPIFDPLVMLFCAVQ